MTTFSFCFTGENGKIINTPVIGDIQKRVFSLKKDFGPSGNSAFREEYGRNAVFYQIHP